MELKTFNQSPARKHLSGRAYYLAETNVPSVNADNVRTSRNPDVSFVFAGPQLPLCVNLKKLRVQRSLKKTERQFFNCDINLR